MQLLKNCFSNENSLKSYNFSFFRIDVISVLEIVL